MFNFKILIIGLIIGGLVFTNQPVQAGFFDWVKSLFVREQAQDLPASVIDIPLEEPIEGVEPVEDIVQRLKDQIIVLKNTIKELEQQIALL
ncbi:MAG: hypothetical protein KJI71_04945 [Patescibacteria group bacterium]|nr:hypothetical protein [Patescibacteria group bacterium]